MPPQFLGVILVILFILAAWFVAELSEYRWLRIAVGGFSLTTAIGFTYFAASIGERFNSNAWYGFATKDLIDSTIANIESGNTKPLLVELKTLQAKFQPTYENRARYDQLVADFIERMDAKRVEN